MSASHVLSDHALHTHHTLKKPKFHHADLPVTSATSPRQTRDVGSFGEVGVMEFGLNWTSRLCCGRHGEVGIVEFSHNHARTDRDRDT